MTAYLDDIESDLSAIHRIDDPYPLPAERVFRLARRLAHYQGAVRNQVAAARRRAEPARPDGVTGPVQWVPAVPAATAASPLADIVSYSKG